ncbi:TIGR03618 family F420-dependent PPOX class oxidoreductase [Salinadaptatus halalkaliphilus]|uniref:TIGR03618 family F420-dependent PPOX class oxidoreductase n=1 Tax=Salinadaptatus halalkaliphilus TaxID=2419781 RepID=A0A4S3TGD8_9EURY|nr:TIGR03618 family F420-dependent PPOX class oxidoreductase [Salinadaptatus halalkaliphilus]THE62902.1 TIGR03618 family F420-dependent PPOX class oxidoreductase [Salinadaptatus halalkaliphilus]
MAEIPAEYLDLFDKQTFAHIATLTDEHEPHVTPVWIDYDEDEQRLLVNTERGRRKERNLRDNPSVGVSMTDPDDPYRRLAIIGEVDELTTDGARAHIDELARRYTDADEYQMPIETERIIVRIRVDEVVDATG